MRTRTKKVMNKAIYADLLRQWGGDPDAGIAAVHGRGGDGLGLASSLGPDYTGEAGFSQRLRVYWPDGEVTLCCVKGMIGAGTDEQCPGEMREWWIR
ncbi:MAG: hypothetical protein EBR82_71135 [Caulobacteraceae bacterium]|nr:hypothetical protein [Caulobacteraceae bacterium]